MRELVKTFMGGLARVRESLGLERNVVVLGLSSMVGTFGNSLWVFFFSLILQAQGFGVVETGLVYGFSLLLAALLQIPMGTVVDRVGRKRSAVLSQLLGSAATLLMALSSNPLVFVLSFLVFSSVSRTWSSIANSAMIMESVSPGRVATSYGSFKTMAGLLAIAAPAIGGVMMGYGFREVLVLSSALLFCMVIVREVFLRETLSKEPIQVSNGGKLLGLSSLANELKGILGSKPFVALVIAYAMYNLLLNQVSYVIPLYAQNVLRLTSPEIGLMFSVLLFLSTLLALPFGKLADRVGVTRIIQASWILEMISMMVFAYSSTATVAISSFGLWVTFGGMDDPALQSLLNRFTKSQTRGLSLGAFNTLQSLLNIPSTIALGILYAFSTIVPFYTNLVLNAAALVLIIRFVRGAQEKPL